MRTITLSTVVALLAAFVLAACSSIDCPLNNRVYAKFRLEANTVKMQDTLTIATPRSADNQGDDTILVNRIVDFDSIQLPMSYQRAEDVYLFEIRRKGSDTRTLDTVWVAKENVPHFESVDCNPQFFHTITSVRFTDKAIENITINNNKVTYNDAKPHFLIRFKGDSN